jgi:hypothetical protein
MPVGGSEGRTGDDSNVRFWTRISAKRRRYQVTKAGSKIGVVGHGENIFPRYLKRM